ncbi:Uncharacterized protein dnm_050590 [Desulfonema magnum]|uniref:Uncharacterized protein n=1 Tax=Desulfonema magnum TaxID=45655 RepID=A0A975BPF0_9BACT|nr:Uncharacterized protein dnm_050590 [Desulfonema magnum]
MFYFRKKYYLYDINMSIFYAVSLSLCFTSANHHGIFIAIINLY